MIDTVSPSSSEYHRLQRSDPRHRWWRPLAVGLVAIGIYLAVVVALVVAVIVVGDAVPAVQLAVDRSWDGDTDLGDPSTFALLLGLLVLMLPSLLLAARLTGSRPGGLLSSVTGRFRFRWFCTAMLVGLVIWAPAMVAWVAVEAAAGTLQVRQVAPTTTFALLALTVALVPFQAAAEEYVFRGYLAQLVGSWLRHPAFAVLLPVPLFVVGHGYETLGAVDVAAFAVLCGWLTWRTGGLEAAIAMHVANNVVLMSLTAVGLGDPNADDTSLLGLAVSIVMMAVFTVCVSRRADAFGITRTRRADLGLEPAPAPAEHAVDVPRSAGSGRHLPESVL